MELATLVYLGVTVYLAPFLFAIGVILFIYGCIEYFVIDGNEQHGRELFLTSILWFLAGLIVYGLVLAFGWVIATVQNPQLPSGDMDGGSGVGVEREQRTLGVPNVPRENTD